MQAEALARSLCQCARSSSPIKSTGTAVESLRHRLGGGDVGPQCYASLTVALGFGADPDPCLHVDHPQALRFRHGRMKNGSAAQLTIIHAMSAMRWRLLRLGVAAGAVTILAGPAPYAAADPTDGGTLLVAPILPLATLGSDATLSFYGGTSSATLSFPVPAGLVPAALQSTLDLPFNIRSGLLTVTQDDRLISKLGLPLTDLAPLVISLNGVQVVDNSVTVTLTLTALPDDGLCLDQLNPVQFIDGSISYTGTEVAPRTVADFLPPILHKLTIAVPSTPSQAESDTAVQVAASLVARYRSQAPQVVIVPLAEGVTTLDGPALPMERQIIIKEGPDQGISLIGTTGGPQLLISGPADRLTNQTRLLTDGALNMAVSTKVVAGELHSSPVLPGNAMTLAELRQPSLAAVGLSPQVGIALDQTRFGHPTQGLRVHLTGTYTPIPAALGGQVTASVGGEMIDAWPTEAGGVIDHWVDVPDRLVRRYITLAVAVNTSGNTGRCGEFRPITLTIKGSTVVESTPAKPPIPPGFPSLPQALMPQVQIGMAANDFADTVRAAQIVVGLQRLSVVPLSTKVTPLKQAIDSDGPAILISADGWTDKSIKLPVSADDKSITVAGFNPGDPQTTLALDPGIQFGSLQTVFDGRRSLLIATSNGAPTQLDELLRWLDNDPRRWSQLSGSAVVAIAGREPTSVPGRSPVSVYGPPGSLASQDVSPRSSNTLVWWIGLGAVAAVATGITVLGLRARRSRSGDDTSRRHGGGES